MTQISQLSTERSSVCRGRKVFLNFRQLSCTVPLPHTDSFAKWLTYFGRSKQKSCCFWIKKKKNMSDLWIYLSHFSRVKMLAHQLILQTTDTAMFVTGYILYRHFNKASHITFRLNVHLTFITGGGGMVVVSDTSSRVCGDKTRYL